MPNAGLRRKSLAIVIAAGLLSTSPLALFAESSLQKHIGPVVRPSSEVLLTQFVPNGRPSEERVAGIIAEREALRAEEERRKAEAEAKLPIISLLTRRAGATDYKTLRTATTSSAADGKLIDEDYAALAEELVSLGLLTEASSIIPPGMDGTPYALAVSTAAKLLEGKQTTKPEIFRWPEDSLWRTLQAIEHKSELGKKELRSATTELAMHSDYVAVMAMPRLFDEALRQKDIALARDIISASMHIDGISQTDQHYYMQGDYYKTVGQRDNAFQFYHMASKTNSRIGSQAVIEMVNIALEKGDRAILNQTELALLNALQRWAGDETELRLMSKLAEVSEELRNYPVAVDVIRNIQIKFPNTEEAELASIRIPVLVHEMVKLVKAGSIPLEDMVRYFRTMNPIMNANSEWINVHIEFARALSDAELLHAAVGEYNTIKAVYAKDKLEPEQIANVVLELIENEVELSLLQSARLNYALLVPLQDSDFVRRTDLIGVKLDAGDVAANFRSHITKYATDPEFLSELALMGQRLSRTEIVLSALKAKSGLEVGLSDTEQYMFSVAWLSSNKNTSVETDVLSAQSDTNQLLSLGIRKSPTIRPLSANDAERIIDETAEALKLVNDMLE